jgi:hypothetical protein
MFMAASAGLERLSNRPAQLRLVDQLLLLDPGHHLAQALAHLLDLVLLGEAAHRLDLGLPAWFSRMNSLANSAGLDLGQDALHLRLGLVGDDARAAGQSPYSAVLEIE